MFHRAIKVEEIAVVSLRNDRWGQSGAMKRPQHARSGPDARCVDRCHATRARQQEREADSAIVRSVTAIDATRMGIR